MTIIRPDGDTTGDDISERSEPRGLGSQPSRDRTAAQVTTRRSSPSNRAGMKENR